MPFTHPVPDWNAQGAEPPESLKTTGWAINQRPPADYFNWFFYNTAKAIIELQLEAINIDQKGVANGVASLGADGKVPASQLNVSAPADASTTTKGVVQLSNSTTSTSETLAATPKAVKDAKDGLSAQIGILSGLNTTAKDNLVNAVNELFTFANDGKTKWSSVIGSPLVSSDTFAQMQTKTQTIKNTLATNLTNKGQSSTGTETLTALVNKVGLISAGCKVMTKGSIDIDSSSLTSSGISLNGFDPNTDIVLSDTAYAYNVSAPAMSTLNVMVSINEQSSSTTVSGYRRYAGGTPAYLYFTHLRLTGVKKITRGKTTSSSWIDLRVPVSISNVSKAFLIFTYNSVSGRGTGCTGRILNASNLRFDRFDHSAEADVYWQLIELE